ncbi:hypothetical protein BDW22DRAFT_1342195 [Trametopsis cervina]|nr:hypothetical protein BDW22DRAFT_1342195 [Trametopsis cervina]
MEALTSHRVLPGYPRCAHVDVRDEGTRRKNDQTFRPAWAGVATTSAGLRTKRLQPHCVLGSNCHKNSLQQGWGAPGPGYEIAAGFFEAGVYVHHGSKNLSLSSSRRCMGHAGQKPPRVPIVYPPASSPSWTFGGDKQPHRDEPLSNLAHMVDYRFAVQDHMTPMSAAESRASCGARSSLHGSANPYQGAQSVRASVSRRTYFSGLVGLTDNRSFVTSGGMEKSKFRRNLIATHVIENHAFEN